MRFTPLSFSILPHTLIILVLSLGACRDHSTTPSTDGVNEEMVDSSESLETVSVIPIRGIYTEPFPDSVTIKDYFCTMDSLVLRYDSLETYPITEHIIVQANPWIIDSLAATDYYVLKARGIFNNDQRSLAIFRKGDRLLIPDSAYASELKQRLDSVLIDVNVHEYRLRIFLGKDTLYSFPVRVGQNKTKFLQMAGYVMSLQTNLGSGTIVRIERDPAYINPVNGHRYYTTLRDDGRRTNLPQIPFLETELDGIRTGDMIHPTTNPSTLGKAWSNGCIGTREGDAWRIYYHAPLGTRVTVRYDLDVVQPNGDTLHLPNIYDLVKKKALN
ncbi:MAG: L,D-transpeptidase [Flavobacteriales bacterium]|nr:L,D-transpeptidase [Flavobacteriales bacterium]